MQSRVRVSIGLRHLRYFIAAAEHGSLRKAGVAIEVQESAISRGIRDLEDGIGASLFIRHPSGVSLTLAGQRFLARARNALDQIREASEEAAAIGRAEQGHLKIGLFSSLASGFLSDLFDLYDQRYAGVHIDFVDAAMEDHVVAIRRFEMDAAFVLGRRPWSDCDVLHAWDERLFIALPRGHRLAARAEIAWLDLADETFLVRSEGSGNQVRAFLEQHFQAMGVFPRIVPQQIARYSLIGLVATGRGIVPVVHSETVISMPDVIYKPMAGEGMPFSVIYSPKNDNPAVRTLLSLTRTMLRDRKSPV